MKNIVITSKMIKKELLIWTAMFVIAQIANLYAIIKFDTSFSELYSQLGYVFALSIVLYVLLLLIRYFYGLSKKLLQIRK
ncbi:MAG TPA: hypothetical protein PLS94_08770 [Prolixibacteraceae bacterium]|nr:hypothetical protein [Prolixibacteraceae bacterium]HPR59774.1 hypothetical protein [Prolixibacteraceae bacterium]